MAPLMSLSVPNFIKCLNLKRMIYTIYFQHFLCPSIALWTKLGKYRLSLCPHRTFSLIKEGIGICIHINKWNPAPILDPTRACQILCLSWILRWAFPTKKLGWDLINCYSGIGWRIIPSKWTPWALWKYKILCICLQQLLKVGSKRGSRIEKEVLPMLWSAWLDHPWERLVKSAVSSYNTWVLMPTSLRR